MRYPDTASKFTCSHSVHSTGISKHPDSPSHKLPYSSVGYSKPSSKSLKVNAASEHQHFRTYLPLGIYRASSVVDSSDSGYRSEPTLFSDVDDALFVPKAAELPPPSPRKDGLHQGLTLPDKVKGSESILPSGQSHPTMTEVLTSYSLQPRLSKDHHICVCTCECVCE